ncbi:MAG: hypothetical protein QMD14_05295, partial [Candidatus Aenigmarchaeota archaeon]|nr:hypothetical protein [Candidatus Aenigmarchaeota archaeon]
DRRRDRLKWIDNPDGILTSEEIQQKLTLDEESEKSSATADLKDKAAKKNNEAELKKNDYCYRYSNELKLSPISY